MCLRYLNFKKLLNFQFHFYSEFSRKKAFHPHPRPPPQKNHTQFIFLSISIFTIPQNQSQQCGNVIFHAFDPVIVRLSLDSTNIQHEKLTFELLKPYIEGFSIQLSDKMDIDDASQSQSSDAATKRKSKESQAGKKVSKKKKK